MAILVVGAVIGAGGGTGMSGPPRARVRGTMGGLTASFAATATGHVNASVAGAMGGLTALASGVVTGHVNADVAGAMGGLTADFEATASDAGFSPASFADLKLGFDTRRLGSLYQESGGTAVTPVATGGDPIGFIRDMSPAGNDLFAASDGARGAYDAVKRAIQFDGVDDILKTAGNVLTPGDPEFTLVFAFRPSSVSTVQGVFGWGHYDAGYSPGEGGDGPWIAGDATPGHLGLESTANGARFLCLTTDRQVVTITKSAGVIGTNTRCWRGGVEQTVTALLNGTATPNTHSGPFSVGFWADFPSNPFGGQLEQLFAYERVLTTDQRQAVEAYCYTPWTAPGMLFGFDARVQAELFASLDLSGMAGAANGDPVGSVTDESGNANGAGASSSSARPTFVDSVLTFDAIDDYLIAPDLGFVGDVAMTLACTIDVVDTVSPQAVFGGGNYLTALQAYGVWANNAATESIGFETSGDNGARFGGLTAGLHTVVITKSPGAIADTTRCWIDGVERALLPAGGGAGAPSPSAPDFGAGSLTIGTWANLDPSSYPCLDGIQNVFIYNRVIDQDERRLLEKFCGVSLEPLAVVGSARLAAHLRFSLDNMWEDAAGTVPVTLGSAVRRVDDLSGHGCHALQATLGSRPTASRNFDRGGQYGVTFDGVDDEMLCAVDLSAETAVTFFVVAYTNDGTMPAYQMLLEYGVGQGGADEGFYALYNNLASGDFTVYAYNSKEYDSTIPPTVTTAPSVLSWVNDRAQPGGSKVSVSQDGTVVAPTSYVVDTPDSGPFTNSTLHIGNRDMNAFPLNGDIAEIVVIRGLLTAGEAAAIQAGLQARYGTLHQP